MSRIPYPTKESAPAGSQPVLSQIEKTFGMVPNFFSLLSVSPDALKAVAGMHGSIGKSLGPKTRERIHIAIAEVNNCDYCVSAHTFLGAKFSGLTSEDMALNREGHSTDKKADAAVQFAQEVARTRGHIEQTAIDAVRAAGYSDAEIIDIVAELAFSFMTNIFNNVAETEIDFPLIRTKRAGMEWPVSQTAA
jgi:uncharacterized peroxidase-related enzyme